MGLETYDSEGSIFLKLKHGAICQESKTEREGYKLKEGVLRDGTQYRKWIKPYKAVSGYVTKLEWYDREHEGRKYRGWNIHIDADGTNCVLEIGFQSRANGRFMKLAENIDFRKPVRFSAWQDHKTDTLAFNVQQDGVSVPQKYTRENPHDLPEPIQRASGKWDYGAQEDFLCQRIHDVVIPTVEAANALRPLREAQPEEPEKAKAAAASPRGLENDDPYRDAPSFDSEPVDLEDAPF